MTAPAPPRWTENARYDAIFVAYAVTSKCLTSMPHYRLEQQLTRSGIPIARSTINDLSRRAAQKLRPPQALLFAVIREDDTVYVDETTFKLTTKDLEGVHLDLRRPPALGVPLPSDALGRGARGGAGRLVRRHRLRRSPRLRPAHEKEQAAEYFEVGDVPEAREALDLNGAIYAVEHEAERGGILGTPEHLALRRSVARPFFIELLQLARRLRRVHGPKTLLGRAVAYTWRNMGELRRFLRDARIRPDNNLAEGALRVVALGRKNILFVHSEDAGEELALLYSLVVSCTRNEINPVEYLTDVLNQIDLTNPHELRVLLPDRWKPPDKAAAARLFEAEA